MVFCFAVMLRMIKESFCESMSDEDLVNLLIEDMVKSIPLYGRNGELYYLEKRQVSKLINGKENVPNALKKALSTSAGTIEGLEEHFHKALIPKIIPEKGEALCKAIIKEILKDSELADSISAEFNEYNRNRNQARLVAVAFRYSLMVPNAIKNTEKTHRQWLNNRNIPVSVTYSDENISIPCFRAVFEAYRSKTGKPQGVSIDDFPQYRQHSQRQKEAYFAAEAVRHATRDSLLEDENPFDDLLDESYEGVIETWEQSYPDGFERMEAVLSQAVQVSMESNLITRETVWVTTRVKKGLCHILVNEGRIEGWVHD